MAAFGFWYSGTTTLSLVSDQPTLEMPALPKLDQVRGIYLTINTALGAHVDDLIALAKSSEINAFVIDVKDSQQSYLADPRLAQVVRRLRFAGIFPIARLPVFQHDGEASRHPAWAITTADGRLWRDSGGRFWLDPAGKEYWQFIADEAKTAAAMGFGEVNLDYIRFPSDGHLQSTVYPFWDKKVSRTTVISDFGRFVRDTLKLPYPEVALTGDIFGYLLLRDDDLGIGQSPTELASIFDAVCPMVYPSHYASGNFNFQSPAAHPYEVVFQSLEKGKEIFAKHQTPFTNIRPWIQDFTLVGVAYTPEMVREQMKAITDAGLNQGWMVWNPNNKYRKEIFSASP